MKRYSTTNNVMPSAVAETKELNGITITCDGKGTYTVSGTATANAEISFIIPEFTIPISVGQGGNGTLSFFNTFYNVRATTEFRFMNDDTLIDTWTFNSLNRTHTNYVTIGGKLCNKIVLKASAGDVTNGTFAVMFSNDGQLPAEFVPHLTWQTKSPPKYDTSTDIITTLPQDIITDGQPIGANLFDVSSIGNPPFTNASGTPESAIGTLVDGMFTAKIGLYSRATYLNYSATLTQGTYTISFDAKETIVNSLVLRVRVDGENIISERINNISSTYTRISGTFTLESESQIQIGIMPTGNAQQSTNLDLQFKDIMINTGSTTLPYQPYAPTIIKGNMVQQGTPSPSSIIMPSECGDMTGNLFDKDNISKLGDSAAFTVDNDTIIMVGNSSARNYYYNDKIIKAGTYICSTVSNNDTSYIAVCGDQSLVNVKINNVSLTNSTYIPDVFNTVYGGYIGPINMDSFVIQSDVPFKFAFAPKKQDFTITGIMLNSGSTALPYQPYGYKIPILSGGVTTNVYLSEPLRKIGDYADTIGANGIITRNVGCYEMRGTETWQLYGGNYFTDYFDSLAKTSYKCICTHLIGDTWQSGGGIWIGSDASKTKVFSSAVSGVSSDLDTFKTYLSDQYSAGTPVTVWYVLATPTTEQITMPTIPTTAERQTFDVDTTLKPSEVQLTYHGWHRDEPQKRGLLKDNPLCGIDTYKDILNLATGACTRKIIKLVLTGEESYWKKSTTYPGNFFADVTIGAITYTAICSHIQYVEVDSFTSGTFTISSGTQRLNIWFSQFDSSTTTTDFKTYLQQQYANGTPVTVWYVLATPTTETITVPSGLSGTEEGYLVQDGTPTPTNPIYPSANTVSIWT